jgi:hypothetical protein
MSDAEEPAARHTAWMEGQLQAMLEDAGALIDEEEGRQLLQTQKDQLCQQFCSHFGRALQQECSPPEREVRTWLRERLGIPQRSYGYGSEEEEELQDPPAPTAARGPQQRLQSQRQQQQQQPQQQQQQQSQQPFGSGPRRSDRLNKGQLGEAFTAIHGTVMGNSSRGQSRGRGGTSMPPRSAAATPQASTPAQVPPPRPGRGRGKHKQ